MYLKKIFYFIFQVEVCTLKILCKILILSLPPFSPLPFFSKVRTCFISKKLHSLMHSTRWNKFSSQISQKMIISTKYRLFFTNWKKMRFVRFFLWSYDVSKLTIYFCLITGASRARVYVCSRDKDLTVRHSRDI